MKEGLPFTILVVDDDEDDRMILDEAFLALEVGAEVRKFIDDKGLFNYLDQLDPSVYPCLIVLDNTLGKKGAIDVLAELKENPKYKDIPVVIYTSYLSPAKEEHLRSLGACEVYEKGNTLQEVVEVVKKLRQLANENQQKS